MINLNENDVKKLAKAGAVACISRKEYGIGYGSGAADDFVKTYIDILRRCKCNITFFTEDELKEIAREGAVGYLKKLDVPYDYENELVEDFMEVHNSILIKLSRIYGDRIISTEIDNENNVDFSNEQGGKQK